MDHSVRAYLGRRRTEELRQYLEGYMEQCDCDHYADMAKMILEILWERGADAPENLPPDYAAFWEQLNERKEP